MSTPIFNPDNHREAIAAKEQIMKTQTKLLTWKRDVKIKFKDTEELLEFKSVDASETKDGFLIILIGNDNKILKYPSSRILYVEETLLPPA